MIKTFATVPEWSRYASQRTDKPFPVALDFSAGNYIVKGGPGGQYQLCDIELYVDDGQGPKPLKGQHSPLIYALEREISEIRNYLDNDEIEHGAKIKASDLLDLLNDARELHDWWR